MITRNTVIGTILATTTVNFNMAQIFPNEYAKKTAAAFEISNPTDAALLVRIDTFNAQPTRIDPHTTRYISRPVTNLIIENLDAAIDVAANELNVSLEFDI
jgi:hypothetical protein